MSSTFEMEMFAAAPWGDGPNAIPLALDDYPLFGEMSAEQMRKVRAPVRIQLDSQGGLHALADAPLRKSNDASLFIQHFDVEGKTLGKTSLPVPESGDTNVYVVDYAVDADSNCYLLERTQAKQSGTSNNRLRKIGRDGKPQWSREGIKSSEQLEIRELEGTFKCLLMNGNSHIYLPAAEDAGAIAEIDSDTGEVARIYECDLYSDLVFMNEKKTVVFVVYFPDLNRRGFSFCNLGESQSTSVVGGDELYGWLLYPFGFDSLSRVYAWNASAVGRISPDGRINVIAAFDNVVVRSVDGAIYTSLMRSDEHSKTVLVTQGQSSTQELRVPKETDIAGAHWKLIHVDQQERYYVFGGEAPGQAGTLLVYSRNGELESMTSPPPDLLSLEATVEAYSFWKVDSNGRVYIPVTDAEGFKVLRLSTHGV